mmetsp:Transcript_42933/g.100018  ORF Transcript_42933/g.100018 Transcript_42933/m.100018 type:complete len:172 (+) Transcript_42933:161-676(+)
MATRIAMRSLLLSRCKVGSLGQARCVVARAAQTSEAGPVKILRDEVAAKFARAAQGSPPNISTGQLVQILFEVGAADVREQTVGEVVNFLMEHGFYCQSNPSKRDSYGPVPPPTLGLSEAQRWATLLFFKKLQPSPMQRLEPPARPVCAAAWCPCPPGAAGTKLCALKKIR